MHDLNPVRLRAASSSGGAALWLRPWAESDVDAVWAGFTDPAVAAWNPQLPFTQHAQAEDWLTQKADDWSTGRAASWALCLEDPDSAVVGSVGLSNLDRAREAFPSAHAAVSYWVLPSGRGQGVAAGAAAAAAEWALDDLRLPRVQLLHDLDNTASCRVADRAGFDLEGVLRRSAPTRAGWADQHLHARI